MSTFFRQTAQAMIAKHIDRFPLLKLEQVIDWQPIEQYLNRQKPVASETAAAVPPILFVRVPSHFVRPMAQLLRSRTRTQPYADFSVGQNGGVGLNAQNIGSGMGSNLEYKNSSSSF